MKNPNLPLWLLSLAAFLMPLFGGYIPLDPLPLEPGLASLFGSFWRGPEAATLAHAVIALLIGSALAIGLLQRSVMQFPWPRIAVAALVFTALLLLSVLSSNHKFTSFGTFIEWAFYPLAMFAVVGLAGRREGPIVLASALVAGCFLVAVLGLYEYRAQPDPFWRIFSTWMHPNALAGMLVIGFFAALGIAMQTRGILAAVPVLASSVIALALGLTQSKGGFVSFGAGLVVLAVLAVLWSKGAKAKLAKLGTIAASLALSALLTAALVATVSKQEQQIASERSGGQAAPANPAVVNPTLARVGSGSATAEQSGAFRILLWKGALKIAQANPTGVGIGAYRASSASPGLTTVTQLAHNSYLQLAAEASFLAPLMLLALGVMALFEMLKSSRKLPEETNLLRAGVISAIVAAATHNFIDSDLYHFGTGASLFILLGIGLQLSADAAVPEFLPKLSRLLMSASVAGLLILFFFFGYVELQHAHVEFAGRIGNISLYHEKVAALKSIASADARTWNQAARIETNPAERAAALKNAVDLGPTPSRYRERAQAQVDAGDSLGAEATLAQGLLLDPNNLQILDDLLRYQIASGSMEAERTAQRLIDVEAKTYFQIRALPELVETATYGARAFLASRSSGEKRTELLRPAVAGYLKYLEQTVPKVKMMAQYNLKFGSENPASARATMSEGATAARELASAYRAAGKGEDAAWAETAARQFVEAEAGLSDGAS